jgi:hypothetical protein
MIKRLSRVCLTSLLAIAMPALATMQDVGYFELNYVPIETPTIAGSVAGLSMTASGHKVAFMFQVPKSGTISKLGFRVHTVSTSDTLAVRLETVDGSNNPSGSAYGGCTAGTVSSLVANTAYTVTLGTPATAVRGDRVAMVISFNSYVAGSLTIGVVSQGTFGGGYPGTKLFTASWAQSNNTPNFWVEYNDGSYAPIPGIYNFTDYTNMSVTLNSGTTPDEIALRFQLPFRARIIGVHPNFAPNAANNIDFVLSSTSSSNLTTVTVSSGTSPMSRRQDWYAFPTATTLEANTTYRVSVRVNDSNSLNMDLYQLTANAVQAQMQGGTSFYASTRTDAGTWTDITNYRPAIGIILDQVDVTASTVTVTSTVTLGGSSNYPFSWR